MILQGTARVPRVSNNGTMTSKSYLTQGSLFVGSTSAFVVVVVSLYYYTYGLSNVQKKMKILRRKAIFLFFLYNKFSLDKIKHIK